MSGKRVKGYVIDASPEEEIDNLIVNIEQSVKRIQVCPVLSDEWLVVATEIEKLSNLSALEESSNEAKSEENLQVLGKSENDTLWDTRKRMETLRIIVEQSKTNILIRLIKEFKE